MTETRSAIGRLLSATPARRLLLLIVDDAERAGPAFHEVLGSILERLEAPVLAVLVVTGDADVVVPRLSDLEAAELIERLLAHPNLPPDAIAAIAGACGGNPLAIEHLVSMLADDGHLRWEYGRWTPTVDLSSLPLPADLRSLVARRIGGLTADERTIGAVGAVAREPFDAAVLAGALDAQRASVDEALERLADRGILRRTADATFEFAHEVIREAAEAYADGPAALRMHEAIAERLLDGRRHAGPDLHEAAGAHLEQAFRLGSSGRPQAREEVGRRAADHLMRAARSAADVGDQDAALGLLRRAASLLPIHDAERARLLLDSALALAARGDGGAAERLLADARRDARMAGERVLEHRAAVARALLLASVSRLDEQVEALREAAEAAIEAAGSAGDPATLSASWSARGWVHRVRGNWAGAADAFERAADAAREAGRRREELDALRDLAGAIVDGPAPVAEATQRCRELLDRAEGTSAETAAASALAVLLARGGEAAEARRLTAAITESDLEPSDPPSALARAARVEVLAGSLEDAESLLRRALDLEMPTPQRGAVEASLARTLVELDRHEEAVEVALRAASAADGDDVVSQVAWRSARARCLAVAGRHAEARALAGEALRLADQTDLAGLRAAARMDLAEVLLASGRSNEAGPAARTALRSLERKGSIAQAVRARAILDRVAGRAVTPSESEANATAEDAVGGSAPSAEREPSNQHAEPGEAAPAPDDGAADDAPGETPQPGPERRERHWFW